MSHPGVATPHGGVCVASTSMGNKDGFSIVLSVYKPPSEQVGNVDGPSFPTMAVAHEYPADLLNRLREMLKRPMFFSEDIQNFFEQASLAECSPADYESFDYKSVGNMVQSALENITNSELRKIFKRLRKLLNAMHADVEETWVNADTYVGCGNFTQKDADDKTNDAWHKRRLIGTMFKRVEDLATNRNLDFTSEVVHDVSNNENVARWIEKMRNTKGKLPSKFVIEGKAPAEVARWIEKLRNAGKLPSKLVIVGGAPAEGK